MEREFDAYKLSRSMYPSIFNSFPVIRTASAKKSPFSRTAAHIFVSPGNAPATMTQNVASMERQFNACQTPCSMCLSILNSFRVILCLNQCVSPKIAIFTTFLFPLGTPWRNHAKCCMDRKRIRCLQNTNCLAACAHLTITVSHIERVIGENNGRKAGFFIPPLHSTPPLGGFPSEYRHPLWYGKTRMVSLPDGEKILKICLFVLT